MPILNCLVSFRVTTRAISINFLNWIFLSPLDSLSGIISLVWQYFSLMLSLFMCSCIKWYFMLMCVKLQILSNDNCWLVIFMYHYSFSLPVNSWLRCLSHTASCVTPTNATYSASTVDKATHDCFLLCHVMVVPPIWNK